MNAYYRDSRVMIELDEFDTRVLGMLANHFGDEDIACLISSYLFAGVEAAESQFDQDYLDRFSDGSASRADLGEWLRRQALEPDHPAELPPQGRG